MPRISFDHPIIDDWFEREEQGTSTFDVCNDCVNDGDTAETLGFTDEGYNGDPIPADAGVEFTESEPPDINELNYRCGICGCELTEENYYL